MLMSPNINELATALAKAQGSIQPAIKDKKNPHFKSSYADLASIWEACRTALSVNGLAVIQTVETRSKDAEPILVTTLAHSSGQWMRSEMPIITQKMDPQGIGSALTYYRRYSLASIVGVAPEDDDAEGAHKREYRANVEPKSPCITSEEAMDLCIDLSQCDDKFRKTIDMFCTKQGVTRTLENLPVIHYERLRAAITKNLNECKADLHSENSQAAG